LKIARSRAECGRVRAVARTDSPHARVRPHGGAPW
jgi:hypothetical protein